MDFKKVKRVYVAGKLNDMAVNYLLNVHKMMVQAEEVRKAGFAPFVPAIDLLMGIKFGYSDYHDYFDGSQSWLLASDAVILTPGYETSTGTQAEIKLALENDIPVFDSIKEMKRYFLGKSDLRIIDIEIIDKEIIHVFKAVKEKELYG